jgi:hypothetical protein
MSTDHLTSPVQGTGAPSAGRTWRVGATATGIAVAVNLVVLAVARLAGEEMTVRFDDAATPMTIGVLLVASTTLVPLALPTLVLLALRRRSARAWRGLAVTGLVVGLVTVPLPLTVLAAGGTQATLAAMHVITGVAWFVVVRRAAAGRRGV